MSAFRTWLLGVTAAAFAAALAQGMTPEGPVKRLCHLAGGLVLLLAVFKPLAGLVPGEISLPAASYVTPAQDAAGAGEEVLKTLIAQRTGAYIVDKGRELGVTCTARVGIVTDSSGWPVPWEVTVTGAMTGAQQELLSAVLAGELGIPPARQSFEEVS